VCNQTCNKFFLPGKEVILEGEGKVSGKLYASTQEFIVYKRGQMTGRHWIGKKGGRRFHIFL
jgi:hypothetical protein